MKKGKMIMLEKFFCGLLLILAFSVSAAVAQKTYIPAKNSAERATILEALSVPVSKDLKQKITFTTRAVKVQGNWAFVAGQARNAKGRKPNWKLTEYQKQIDVDAFEDNLFALLRKKNGKWRVVTYMIGCTDPCYSDWDTQYKAPKAIFK
jgi:hypothetical protein